MAATCHAPGTRPWITPLPQALYDSLETTPNRALAAAAFALDSLGFDISRSSADEGYLETRWFDVTTAASSNTSGDSHKVKVRIWTDALRRDRSAIILEAVYEWTADPSLPPRQRERHVPDDHAGFEILRRVLRLLQQSYGLAR
ncbi:MAG: hypothetical protein ACE5FJ_01610 [Gemmatimonadales bacterium]